ncbi:hypothetical protein Nepgr_017581 [Nepenthes gracilis]|uniref:Subtilisin-like protease SBT5.6 n=1 Tax=Nepenthes gracilis TaxID=150966 RepID=A0AAD3SPM1_NEPGR|nr:hypothetical protein Nepgr_017581 [Nepenthes gracilis]
MNRSRRSAMEVNQNLHFSSLILIFFFSILASSSETQMYIVYLGEHGGEKALHEIEETHFSYLQSVKDSEEEARDSLIYSYKHCINGFSAMLTSHQASKLSELKEVVSVFRTHPGKYVKHTTRSWEFVGLEEGESLFPATMNKSDDLLSKANYGRDVIIGHFDSGIWPESDSFSEEGMEPIPKRWKGICQTGDDFNASHCSRKVIGARYYLKAYEKCYGTLNTTLDSRSPRDRDGHGSHTAATVAGRRVSNVSFMGKLGTGTATGGAPLARLAVYKVCWAIPHQEKVNGNTCFEADMLAAMDDAIADGVDVMTLSIGTASPIGYQEDGIAIGALHAVKRNIVVSCSAGNSGPAPGTLSNPAPWIITVGASSLDRKFLAPVVLGNGMKIEGETLTKYKLKHTLYPLVYAAEVELPNVAKSVSGQCLPNSLSSEKANGKIVLCLRGNGTRIGKGIEVKRAGGAGYILGNSPANGEDVESDAHFLPATAVGSANAIKILEYINLTKNPMATIIPTTTRLHVKPAPYMAAFTSRGPNVIDPSTLKPDITAPGLNILAAWSRADPPSKLSEDHRVVKWNFLSGTSMACPHVSATAALLKAVHPSWSSAAIRSAIITSAAQLNNIGTLITDAKGNTADPFQFGAGHLRPTKAADPGLVYDASYADYLIYLCSSGLTKVDPSFQCPKDLPKTNDLNYPSLSIANFNGTVTVKRMVTNVGRSKSTYFASVKPPLGYRVKIRPTVLSFRRIGEKKSFMITVEAESDTVLKHEQLDKYRFGWITWFDGIHNVRSPIVVSSL